MSTEPLNVLIAGAGIAGPVFAWWLHKTNPAHRITIVERSPSPRKTGQSIDIRDESVPVVQKMGLVEAIRARHTQEKGAWKIGSTGRILAQFDATGDVNRQSMTSEFEILRGDLARVFADALEGMDTIQTVYGEYIKAIEQTEKKATVTFMNGRPTEQYDLVVAADGMMSRTRSIVTGRPAKEDLVQIGGFMGYFTMPYGGGDSPTHARFYNSPGGNSVFLRPTTDHGVSAYLMMVQPSSEDQVRAEKAAAEGIEAQKDLLADVFKNAGWETPRVIKGMYDSDDFYAHFVSQVKLDQWAFNRVVLLGDAGYCPSPMTGGGTSSAIYGSYILAGEIMSRPDNIPAALQNYEKKLRPHMESVQTVYPSVIKFLNPKSWWTIELVNAVWVTFYAVCTVGAWLRLPFLLNLTPFWSRDTPLPQYNWPE